MAANQALGAASLPGRAARSASRAKPSVSSQSGGELATLYVSIAAVGMAALSSAAASSLFAGLHGLGGAAVWAQGVAAAVACAWAGAGLLYAFVSFHTANLAQTILAVRAVALAASVHLAVLLAVLWRLPEVQRSFDLTLASLILLELSVVAVLGWQHNASLRVRATAGAGHTPSAMAVVGTLFAASILVAAVTTAGMAASTAGELAVPHFGHGVTTPGSPQPGNLEQLKHSGHHH